MNTTRTENPERQGSESLSSLVIPPSGSETSPTARPNQRQRRIVHSSSPISPRASAIPRRLLLPIIRSSVSMYNSTSSASASSSNSARMSDDNLFSDINNSSAQRALLSSPTQRIALSRSRSRSRDDESNISTPPTSPVMHRGISHNRKPSAKAKALDMNSTSRIKSAQKENDSMIYLDGPQIYTCAQCRTHFTSHDDIISKSFHGRHGRAYLFDQCVNVTIGPPEDRNLMTGLHSVCDIYCKRCKNLVGWTYAKAYESSQKYKEGKFIIEKINLHMEESDYYEVNFPAGERRDRWRMRSISWGSERSLTSPRHCDGEVVYEYKPCNLSGSLSPYLHSRSVESKVSHKTPSKIKNVRNLPPPPSL